MPRRPCFNEDGSNKRRYLTRKTAKKNCRKGYACYPCLLHGDPVWHVGRTRYKPKSTHEEVTPAVVP